MDAMNRSTRLLDLLAVCSMAFAGWVAYLSITRQPLPHLIPLPIKPDDKPPRRPLLPRIIESLPTAYGQLPIGAISTGGPLAADGKTQVTCDLPVSERQKNVGGRNGAGLCVFTSIMHSARWQNEHRLENFQEQMRKEPGGGYPEKVDKMISKYGAGTPYVQYEGADPSILKAALAGGRMPGVTYNGHDPHYRGTIAHMVNLVCFDEAANLAAILDNNFIGENELVWLSIPEFMQRWKGGRSGWAVVLLNPPPPPVPKN
jgi:hypothetical protein